MSPVLIPDFLVLVGDSADGYPGIGKADAARLLNQYGPIEVFPEKVLGKKREQSIVVQTARHFKNRCTAM